MLDAAQAMYCSEFFPGVAAASEIGLFILCILDHLAALGKCLQHMMPCDGSWQILGLLHYHTAFV